jgi:hypothetical protein
MCGDVSNYAELGLPNRQGGKKTSRVTVAVNAGEVCRIGYIFIIYKK